jgi:uncharacterized cupin superfamily protein
LETVDRGKKRRLYGFALRYRPAVLQKVLRKAVHLYARSVHGLGSHLTAALLPAPDDVLDPFPIPEAWILSGTPAATARFLVQSGDAGLVAGVWDCTAGSFDWHFECDEIIYVLDGDVEVEHEGQRQRFERGSLVFFPVGARTRWHVATRIRKLFIHRHPTPLARKLVGLA